MKRVLTVLETNGMAPQDIVRGAMFRELFERHGLAVRYVGRSLMMPLRLSATSTRVRRLRARARLAAAVKRLEAACTPVANRRIARIARDYDVVHLIKTRSIDLVRKIRRNSSARIVYDLGDAVWQPFYKEHCAEVDAILGAVDAVTCDNRYGLAYARQFNSQLFLWPPPSQVELFDAIRASKTREADDGRVVLGWVGSRMTAFNLYVVWDALERLFEKHEDLSLRLLGIGKNDPLLPWFERVRVSARPVYGPREMLENVLDMDIGLYPLFDNENSRVRGILKALVYMGGEAAIVCSPVGECCDLIHDGVNGLLARSSDEWFDKLDALVTDAGLRQQLARAGLETVRKDYTLEKGFESLRAAFAL